ncbi:MAG: hypothetical protein Q7V19_17435 [Bacteroidales bacterium]|nr:hypothetical protein [Bacteroidales bacterium]MDP2236392.1 hypothetical protein [Bacteroidales bacterium]
MNILFLFSFLAVATNLNAGWFIVEKREDKFGNLTMQSVFIQDQKLRVENQTSSFIFDLENEYVTVIFPKRSVFWSGKPDTLKTALFNTIETQIVVMIQQMPERDRIEAEADFKKVLNEMKAGITDTSLPVNANISATDSSMKILDYQAEKYLFILDSITLEEFWITREVVPYKELNLVKLNEMMRVFSRPSMLSVYRESKEWLEIISEGLVLRSVIPTTLGQSEMEVVTVRKAEIPVDFFDPPPTYRGIGIDEVISIMMGEDDVIKSPEDYNTSRPELFNKTNSAITPTKPNPY